MSEHSNHLPHEIAVYRARKHLKENYPEAFYPVIEEALAQIVMEDAELRDMFFHEPERAIGIAVQILKRDSGGNDGDGVWIVNGERVSTFPV